MNTAVFCSKALVAALFCSALFGCSSSVAFPNVNESSNSDLSASGSVLSGHIHGGQQPIAGAKIYLLAAGTTGYGSAATSLLTSTSQGGYTTKQDSTGWYATTDANGNFQIADTCSPGQQVYVASIGGNPGAGSNTAANEIAALGQCPSAGNFDSTLSGVFISEISTIAAAYATSAYAVDTFHIGSPTSTTLEKTGIANAFANAANLFDVQSPNGFARTATISGNGVVPQAKIHALANIIAACVNSSGSSSSACTTLFLNAKTNGSTGTTPNDVTTAAINIAHNPSANVNTLFGLQTSVAPFATAMRTAPNDFALTLSFSNGALGSNPSLAIDAGGNLFTMVPGATAVGKLSPLGALQSGRYGYSLGSSFSDAHGLALDTNNILYVVGRGVSSSIPYALGVAMTGTGVVVGSYAEPTYGTTHPPAPSTNLVTDGSGDFWFVAQQYYGGASSTSCCTMKVNMSASYITELNSGYMTPGTNYVMYDGSNVWSSSANSALSLSASANSSVTGGGLNVSDGLALDHAGNLWVANSGDNSLSEFNNAGTAVSTTTGYTGGGLAAPKSLAVDGLGNVWVTNSSGSYGLSQFTSAGAAVGSGYSTSGLTNAGALAIDPSGNMWVADASSSTLLEYIGLAAPVVTPTASAISGGLLGARP